MIYGIYKFLEVMKIDFITFYMQNVEDTKKILGKEEEINEVFINFQKYLYYKELS